MGLWPPRSPNSSLVVSAHSNSCNCSRNIIFKYTDVIIIIIIVIIVIIIIIIVIIIISPVNLITGFTNATAKVTMDYY